MMRALWLFLVLLLMTAGAGAQLAVGKDDSYVLSRSFSFLEDEQRQLTLDDVLEPQAQARFRAISQFGPGANFGLTTSAYWLRVVLNVSAAAPSEWMFEIAYPPLD